MKTARVDVAPTHLLVLAVDGNIAFIQAVDKQSCTVKKDCKLHLSDLSIAATHGEKQKNRDEQHLRESERSEMTARERVIIE